MNTEEKAALDVVNQFLERYAQRDLDGCLATIAQSKPVIFFGTNTNEVFTAREQVCEAFRSDFDNMHNICWGQRRQVNVQASPTLACVMIELPISYENAGESVQTIFRYAMVLCRDGESWKILSGMASVPFAAGTYSFAK